MNQRVFHLHGWSNGVRTRCVDDIPVRDASVWISTLGWLTCGVAIVCAQSCDRHAASRTFTERDSAGIRIIESVGASWAADQGWTVGIDPSVQIGSVEGQDAYLFSRVAGAWRMDDGRIIVAEGAAAEIRIFDQEGRFLESAGRRGDGPGEFQVLAMAVPYRGDSIAAWDPRTHRITLLDRNGRLGRVQGVAMPPFEAVATGAGTYAHSLSALFRGTFDDGAFVFTLPILVRYGAGERWSWDETFVRYSAEGVLLDTLAVYPGPSMIAPYPGSVRLSPFARNVVAAVDGRRLLVGPNVDYEVHEVDQAGILQRILRVSGVDLSVNPATQDAYREQQRSASVYRSVPQEQLERALLELEFPSTHPPYAQMIADSDDNLWVRDYSLPGTEGPDTWKVFDSRRRLMGTVDLPAGLIVHQIGDDFVLGVSTNELDVPFVRMYPVSGRG